MKPARAAAVTLFLLAVLVIVAPAAAMWPHEANNGNLPVCTAVGNQLFSSTLADDAGGVFVAWSDTRAGGYDIYLQRVSAAGVPMWTSNGVVLCSQAGTQLLPELVTDGAGGVIAVWNDFRSGSGDVYAQRVNGAGVAQWTTNGVALCTATGEQQDQHVVPDGAGGAIVSWWDLRSGVASDLYAQRVNAAGSVQWAANGVAVCLAAGSQADPEMLADASGGAFVTWDDARTGGSTQTYAQRLNSAGVAQWTADGVLVCAASITQQDPEIATDGASGVILTWQDGRSGLGTDLYAQRLNSAGVLQWTAAGVPLTVAADNQDGQVILADGSGGAIVAWSDYRSATSYDVYAQRVSATGLALWTPNGVALCVAAGDQTGLAIATDGASGAITCWQDYRSGTNLDIYAQRTSAAGATQWMANGVGVCTTLGDQTVPSIVSDAAGGAILAWPDARSGINDMYAQRLDRYAVLGTAAPVIAKVQDVPNDQGGLVKVSWDAPWLDADPIYGIHEYRVFRSVPGALGMGSTTRRVITEDSDVAARGDALLATFSAGATIYWEYVATQLAEGFAGYSSVVATTSDSVAGSNPYTLFMVEARASTASNSPRWSSAPDSGYSTDNLAPATPAPLTGTFSAGTTSLHWSRNTEADLAGYRLYRGTSAAFVPGPSNLIAALADTGYADAAGAPAVYKLTAIDSHGNESAVATLLPAGTLGVDGAVPLALAFAAPSPNPARTSATLEYSLSRAGHVRLSVFDAAGRCVRVLRDEEQVAGAHREPFALRDANGRGLASGLYVVRLEAEGRVLVRRVAAIR